MTYKAKRVLTGMAFLLPSFSGVMVFYLIPFGISLVYSFSRTSGRFSFAGLYNYEKLLQSGAFSMAVKTTMTFILVGLALLILLGYCCALLLRYIAQINAWIGGASITCILLPMVIPSAAMLLFIQLLTERYGIINGICSGLGISTGSLLQTNASFCILLCIYIWKNIGYTVAILLSGLLAIPHDMIEAARMDGASEVVILFSFEFVYMLPYCCVAAIMGIIAAFKMYRESYLLMGLYPHQSVYMLQNFLNNNFESLNYQRLATGTVFFILLIGALLALLLRIGFANRE